MNLDNEFAITKSYLIQKIYAPKAQTAKDVMDTYEETGLLTYSTTPQTPYLSFNEWRKVWNL
mgnify:CR=1 FL=1